MSKPTPACVDPAKHLLSRRHRLAEARFWRAIHESMEAIKRGGNDPDSVAFSEYLGWQAYGRAAIDQMHDPVSHRK